MNTKQLKEMIDSMFSERLSYMMLLQELAENFYPQRANFTVRNILSTDYASNLMSSYPVQVRRELGDQIGQMLRPTNLEWFEIVPKGGEKTNNDGQRWLDEASRRMRLAMYARPAKFNRMTKQGDHDFAAFGACPFSCRLNSARDNLLYRNHHIRDMVWHENEEGDHDVIARKLKPSARDLKILFGDRTAPGMERTLKKAPLTKIKCYHIMVMADMYDGDARDMPWFSIYYDCEHNHLLEAVPMRTNEYRIPCWQRVSDSQYPFSPATITALPDGRLLQSMAYTILEAGEKAVNPPILATVDAVRSDMALYAGGVTWLDKEYDEKAGAAMRTLDRDLRGLPFGLDMIDDTRLQLAAGFFLNKLTLPERAPEMTAYEVGQRIQEYIRGALPIFEPMEPEYNGGICEVTFETLFYAGVFGSPRDIPPQLLEEGVEFSYRSPLHDAIDEQQGQKYLEAKALVAESLDLDRGAAYVMDTRVALREALDSIGLPAKWINPEEDIEEMVADAEAAEAEAAEMQQMLAGSEAAKNISQAGKDLELV